MEWKTAIRCAAAVAGVGAVLMRGGDAGWTLLSPVSFLWIMSASLITLGFYQKRRPAAWMDVRVGARIGVVVGCAWRWSWGWRWPGRGWWRALGCTQWASFDAQMTECAGAEGDAAEERAARSPMPAGWMEFIGSPEFRGGYAAVLLRVRCRRGWW